MDKKEIQKRLREQAAAKKEKELLKIEKAECRKKEKSKKGKAAQNDLFLKIAVFGTAIFLVGLCVYVVRHSLPDNTDKYDSLKSAYESLLKDNDSYVSENLSLREEIDYLRDENERVNQQVADLESILNSIELKEAAKEANPYDDTYVSEYYVTKKKSWNLIENVSVSNGTTDFIEINDKFYYAIYSPQSVTVNKYDSKKELIGSEKCDVSQGQYFDFGQDCAYVTLTYTAKNTYFVSSGIQTGSKERPDRGNYFYVVGKNAPANVTFSYAGRCLKSGGTILVLPGTYIDNVDVQNKTANIIGVDRNLCSLISYEQDYYKPPLEIAAGKVVNLTIEAVSDGRHSAELSAYGIHSDFNYLMDKTLLIDNCTVKSDYNSSIGVGLRKGTITISNCTFDDIFFHDSDDESFGGAQNIKFIGNTFTNMIIHSQEKDSADVKLTFKKNSFKGISAMNAYTGGSYDGYFKGLKGFTLTEDSAGNSLGDVNY
ncbi:MAG: hypothetical protein J5626_02385 [Lachnospiraceae bacterium]|nr:hypothetical protein [Lachnospiraceae bacterium]